MAEQLCPRCNTPNRVSARFCANCGEPLLFDLLRQDPSSTQTDTEALQSTEENEIILAGRYRLERELGRGGFGAVYEALDLNLNRRIALKENLDTSPDAFRQFVREASTLANLSHPNLPRVTDHFTIPNQGQYLVMDYVDGEDLEDLLKQQGPMPVDQVMFWIFQVIDALEYLHDQPQPIIHRDIKPANIRVTPKGKAVLVDFGLVKLYEPGSHTTLGARAVTPGFAPPEQYGTGKTDVRSDIYALGATLYTILTGKEPLESVQRIQGEKQPAAHTLMPALPPALGQVIDQSMALNPADRFPSMTQFKAALQLALAGSPTIPEPKTAPPPPAPARDTGRPSQPVNVSTPVSGPRPTGPKPAGAPRSGSRILPAAGVSVLAVICVAIIAIIGSVAYYNSQSPARITQTVQSQRTLSAQLYITQTAQHRSIAGLLGTNVPAENPAANPGGELPAWPEKFIDGFDGASTSFWVGADTAHAEFANVTAALQNGLYHLELNGAKRQKAYWWTKSPQLQTGNDFLIGVNGAVTQGAADAMSGVVFHLDEPSGRFYLFAVNRAQEFGVWKVENGNLVALQEPKKSDALTTGANELIVVAQSDHYRFYINGSLVAELTDSAFSGGEGGMYFAVGSDLSAAFDTDRIQLKAP